MGRPNVGKSALFNRIAGRRIAIVHDQPGVTRDRISAEVEWQGHPFTLVDTGGIGLVRGEKAADVIGRAALDQVKLAIDAAQAIILVVNAQEGVVPLDLEVSVRLRASAKPVLVAVNKVDTSKAEPSVTEFSELGFPKLFPVSAIHGRGLDALMDAALALLPVPEANETAEPPADDTVEATPEAGEAAEAKPARVPQGPVKLAIVGRPNVGKSSIVNALTNSERVIVSPVPGTTRDSVDVPLTVQTDGLPEHYLLIDTAGMRKTKQVADSVEFFSVNRAEQSIARCDIAIFVLDAEAGILEQDKKIGDRIVQARKACIVVVNKWDLVEEPVREARLEIVAKKQREGRRHGVPEQLTTLGEFGKWVQDHLFFLDYAPVIFTSAKSGFHLDRLLEAVRYVAAQLRQQIPTALLNRALNEAIEHRQPVTSLGRRLKFFYATQVRQSPPTFLLFVNDDELFSDQYRKYLGDSLRRSFGYEGCPIILLPRSRPKTIEPKRRPRPSDSGQGLAQKSNLKGKRFAARRPAPAKPSRQIRRAK